MNLSLKGSGTIQLRTFHASEAKEVFEDLADLRIEIFKSFPYLYLGERDYEKKYLERYFLSTSFFLAALYDKDQMVGATTAIKLSEETDEIKAPWLAAKCKIENCFYFGESLLLENYRGQGYGNLFFDLREQHALKDTTIESTLFCSVVRPMTHPLKPKNYLPHDAFWLRRGYTPQQVFCSMTWQDTDQKTPTEKNMQFWKKDWK